MAGEPWTQAEVQLLAQEYFAVLEHERAGRTVNKSDFLRRAQSAMPVSRTIHTLKDRCYRISEELWKRDLPYVDGWKPPALVGQSPNSVNVAATIWAAIEPLVSTSNAVAADVAAVMPNDGSENDSQAYETEAERRQAIEDVAQHRLMKHFTNLGWLVEDTHLTSPFDARATKGADVQYLEAKGTTSLGQAVFVTRGEVEWARAHRGQCVMGIVSSIQVDVQGVVDGASGTLRLLDWDPDAGDLKPVQYEWTPSA